MLTGVGVGILAVLGAVGWALWYVACQAARSAHRATREAISRARLADAKAAAAQAEAAAVLCAASAAEAQARIAQAENMALRRSLADARATQRSGEAAERKPDDFFDSSTGKLRVYRVRRDGEGE